MKQDTQPTEAIDLFEHLDKLPKELKKYIENFGECETYLQCKELLAVCEKYGYTFEYYLDAMPYDLRKTETTEVQFRLFRGEVTAVFPYIVESPCNVACYMHIGQHSVCHWDFNSVSKPATPEQYADLYKELESIGYKLKVIKRRNHAKYLQAYKSFINSKTVKK